MASRFSSSQETGSLVMKTETASSMSVSNYKSDKSICMFV